MDTWTMWRCRCGRSGLAGEGDYWYHLKYESPKCGEALLRELGLIEKED